MKTWLFPVLYLLFSYAVVGQVYVPVDTLNPQRKTVLRYFAESTKELEKEFKSYKVSDRKIIKSFVQSRKGMFEELTKDSYLLYDTELESYINSLLHRVARENGVDSKNLRIFLSRDTAPNAYSLGDGNFVFNISLLNRLDTEDELLFIIAHELAHYSLDHLKEQMMARMHLSSSKEYQEKQKELKRTKYNKFTKSLEQYRELLYENRSVGRKRELQADSMAFLYVRNIIADQSQTVSALQKLDSLSPAEIYKVDQEILKEHFTSPSMPFQEEWNTGYDFSKYKYKRGKIDVFGIHKDSVSSHPEKEERLRALANKISSSSNPSLSTVDEFQGLKEKIAMEDVYAHYCLEQYGRGIYLILQLQNLDSYSDTKNLFYSKMLALFYQELSEARKTFTFKRYVDEVDITFYSQEYNLFLTILDNLRSSELHEMSLKFKS